MTIKVKYQPNEQYIFIEGVDCFHQQVEYEDFTLDYMSFAGHGQHEWTEPVCQVCGEVLERDEPDYED